MWLLVRYVGRLTSFVRAGVPPFPFRANLYIRSSQGSPSAVAGPPIFHDSVLQRHVEEVLVKVVWVRCPLARGWEPIPVATIATIPPVPVHDEFVFDLELAGFGELDVFEEKAEYFLLLIPIATPLLGEQYVASDAIVRVACYQATLGHQPAFLRLEVEGNHCYRRNFLVYPHLGG